MGGRIAYFCTGTIDLANHFRSSNPLAALTALTGKLCSLSLSQPMSGIWTAAQEASLTLKELGPRAQMGRADYAWYDLILKSV